MTPARRRYDYDEDDVRVRPNRRGTRPRSKDRPSYDDAAVAVVTSVDRGRYSLSLDGVPLVAVKARELGRRGAVVGDRVRVVGDTSGAPDTLARLVRREERTSALRRTADDTDATERVIVANADQLLIVTALADPEPRPRLIDRCLVAAYDAGLRPTLVLTKGDLASPDEMRRMYEPLGVPIVVSRQGADGGEIDAEAVATLHGLLRDHVSVLVGHSGVGKSTLVNALVPDAGRTTGHVNAVTGRGRHTSTNAIALPLADGGWVIDTPGIRTFGLAHVHPETVIDHFPELEQGTEDCPRGCSHDEEDCALDEYVASGAAGEAGPERLDSLRRLLRALREARAWEL